MTAPVVARCPAKVNLSLRVLRRREDGYHELDTVFQAIDLWDEVELRPAATLSLDCPGSGLAGDETNLVWKAATLLRERHAPGAPGASIVLRKHIPLQAGLGGGSSDAAATLLGCCRLWGLSPGNEALASVARDLGADVPFFLTGGTARGTGRGDEIEALPPVRKFAILLGLPPFGIPTAEVFSGLRGRLTPPSIGVSLPVLSGHKWPEDNDFGFMVNDLETVAYEVRPELRRFRDAVVAAGARRALLSGSGSTVYGVFDTADTARTAADRLGDEFSAWRRTVTRPIDDGVRLRATDG